MCYNKNGDDDDAEGDAEGDDVKLSMITMVMMIID
jgi:hypothetical protein